MKKRDNEIENFEFSSCPAIYKLLKKRRLRVAGSRFELYTAYPGVLIGTGNPHEISMENAIKCGFSFDYVTGLPYIPGSSIKGMLRSYFSKRRFSRRTGETSIYHRSIEEYRCHV